MKRVNLLVVIINHGLNDKALELKASFAPHVPVIAIDSGSVLTDAQRAGFDLALPNVYYGGCMRAAAEYAMKHWYTHVWIWASDVSCENPAEAVMNCREAFASSGTGVYAPSADYSFHRQMRPAEGEGLCRVSFTDGFCFAACTSLLTQTCLDFEGSSFGFGMDIHLGLLARKRRQSVLVDHRYQVSHPRGAGYSVAKATSEWKRWRNRQSLSVRLFHRLARKRVAKTPLGMRCLLALPWTHWDVPAQLEAAEKLAGGG